MSEVSVGSTLPWDVFDEDGRLLLSRGHVVTSSTQIGALVDRGLFAEIHVAWERDRDAPPVPARLSAAALILDARANLQGACAPQARKESFTGQVLHVRQLIQDACRQSQNVALAMILLEREDSYAIRHAVDAAVICHIVGTDLGIQEPELSSVVAAALTMNISMLRLQDALQASAHPPTPEQREVIARHPQQSAEMLRQHGVTDETWISTVLNHHEAMDGSGYPGHKKAAEIPLPAQLVSMADIYCARVSSRDYRKPLRPSTALKALFVNQGGTVNKELATRFIKTTGIYPPGTPVRLASNEIAIVIGQGEKANTPLVAALIGSGGARFAIPLQRDTSLPDHAVRDVVDWPEAGPIPGLRVLWGKEGMVG